MLKNKFLLIIGLILLFIQFYPQIELPSNLHETIKILQIRLPFIIAQLLVLLSVAAFIIYILINKKTERKILDLLNSHI